MHKPQGTSTALLWGPVPGVVLASVAVGAPGAWAVSIKANLCGEVTIPCFKPTESGGGSHQWSAPAAPWKQTTSARWPAWLASCMSLRCAVAFLVCVWGYEGMFEVEGIHPVLAEVPLTALCCSHLVRYTKCLVLSPSWAVWGTYRCSLVVFVQDIGRLPENQI